MPMPVATRQGHTSTSPSSSASNPRLSTCLQKSVTASRSSSRVSPLLPLCGWALELEDCSGGGGSLDDEVGDSGVP